MTSMRVCPKHERAYPSDGQCEWCEPETVAQRIVRDMEAQPLDQADRDFVLQWAAERGRTPEFVLSEINRAPGTPRPRLFKVEDIVSYRYDVQVDPVQGHGCVLRADGCLPDLYTVIDARGMRHDVLEHEMRTPS